MQKLSVVIVCRDEADVIGETLRSFSGLTDDIVVYDNGSMDGTQEIVVRSGARLFEGDWEGFGKTKNKANELAKYDWILSLDADEAIDDELKKNLLEQDLSNDDGVYELRFKNFIGSAWLRFGEWGDDKHIRLFNRKQVRWNLAGVHESLMIPPGIKRHHIKGYVLHKTANSIREFEDKMKKYAILSAEKYFMLDEKHGVLKAYLSAFFSFVKNYFFKLGFLDGLVGFHCARINASYTFLKYKQLQALYRGKVQSRF